MTFPGKAAFLIATFVCFFVTQDCVDLNFENLVGTIHDRAPAALKTVLHSHNDYQTASPLGAALNERVTSIEADVWLRDGKVMVSHWGWSSTGSLKDLYLDPLQARVDREGSVMGDGKPFYLWIDIKDPNPKIVPALRALMAGYSMFSAFGDSDNENETPIRESAVTAILSGNEANKLRFVSVPGIRLATRDSLVFQLGDPPADSRWRWYSLKWSNYFKWNGRGEMPVEEIERLRAIIATAHSKGRRVRIWAPPKTEAAFRAVALTGVDLFGTDLR